MAKKKDWTPSQICRLLRSYSMVPFADQEADLRRLLETLPVARLSVDRSGIGMNLAENLSRDYPQVVAEAFSNASKERWCTDFKILLQRRDLDLPRDRELVSQIHSIKRRFTPSGNVSFDAERTGLSAERLSKAADNEDKLSGEFFSIVQTKHTINIGHQILEIC